MQKRAGIVSVLCGCAALGWILTSSPWTAQAADEEKKVLWTHGLNFKVRPAGESGFEKAKKFGAEAFQDKDLGKLVFVLDTGSLGLGSSAKLPPSGRDPDNPTLYHALEVKARKPGQEDFKEAPQFGIEVFKDINTDNLVYISDTGSLASMPAGSIGAPEKIKDPVWFHGLEMKVRKAGEKDFDKAKKVSMEVYKDENTNQLVYVTSTGNIAMMPAGDAKAPSEVKGPTWHHAFEVKVRKANEKEFTKDTKMYGVEVYKDENVNALIYVCETGAIAVVPAGTVGKPESSKPPEWVHGRSFRVRTFDMTDFNDKTPNFGAEVYKDVNAGFMVYLTDIGALTVFPAK